jgi:hypothetical protein
MIIIENYIGVVDKLFAYYFGALYLLGTLFVVFEVFHRPSKSDVYDCASCITGVSRSEGALCDRCFKKLLIPPAPADLPDTTRNTQSRP